MKNFLAKSAETVQTKFELFSQISEQSPNSILITNAEGFIEYVNPTFCERTVLSYEQILGQHYSFFIPEGYLSLCDDGIMRGDVQSIRKDGTKIWESVVISTLKDADGITTNCFIIKNDITSRVELSRVLEENARILCEAQAIANLGSYDQDVVSGEWKSSEILDAIFGIDKTYPHTTEGWIALIHPDNRDSLAVYYHEVITVKHHFDFVYKIVRKNDGVIRFVHGLGSVECDRNGNPIQMIGTIQDITDRWKTEIGLSETREIFETVVHIVPAMIFLKDAVSLKFVLMNKAGENFLGYSQEELYGKSDTDFFPTEQATFFMAKDHEVLNGKTGVNDNIEEYVTTKDKSVRILRTRKVCVRGNDGTPKYLLGVSVDITDQKRVENELRESEAKLKEAQHLARIGSWELNLLSNQLVWSDEIFDIFEIDKGKFGATYDSFLEVIHPDDRERVNAAYTSSVSSHQTYEISHRLCMPDGRIKYVEERCATHYDSENKPIRSLGTVQDVTRIKEAELALRETANRLEESLVGTLQTVSRISEMRDPYTALHQDNVASLSAEIAEKMGLPTEQVDEIRKAGLVHDIGKAWVPIELLTKPSRLLPIEFALLKHHAQAGYDALRESGLPEKVKQIVLQHHERLNGSGYPQGLKEDEILLEAKIVAVADVVDAMMSLRPYRAALGVNAALVELTKNRGIIYDRQVVDVCFKILSDRESSLSK